jgi:hypothetical protein
MKTFNVAGVSTQKGQTKIRFANDLVDRFKALDRNGHSDIRLIELGEDLTKAQIVQVLMNHPQFQDELAQTAIYEYAVRNCKEIAKEINEVDLERAEEDLAIAEMEEAGLL